MSFGSLDVVVWKGIITNYAAIKWLKPMGDEIRLANTQEMTEYMWVRKNRK